MVIYRGLQNIRVQVRNGTDSPVKGYYSYVQNITCKVTVWG
jgi:hypothetical protein